MLEKNFFFVGETPPNMSWNVPGTVLAACRQLPGVHAYSRNVTVSMQTPFRCARVSCSAQFSVCPFFLPNFRFVANVGILRLFPNGIRSSHLMSCHGRTDSGRLDQGRQAASGLATRARPSALGNVHFSMCTLPVEHVHASRCASVHFQLSMCTPTLEHAHAST